MTEREPALIDELLRLGIRWCGIAPGQSTIDLATAAIEREDWKTVLFFNEATLAFAGIGVARITGLPAALILSNYASVCAALPAIYEASEWGLPILVICRDTVVNARPALLSAAFSKVVSPASASLNQLLMTLDQAYFHAVAHQSGPVLFDLTQALFNPDSEDLALTPLERERLDQWACHHEPYQLDFIAVPGIQMVLNSVPELIADKRGFLILGALDSAPDRQACLNLTTALSWPVFADIQSGLHLMEHREFCPCYHFVLKNLPLEQYPEVIAVIGHRFISHTLLAFLNQLPADIPVLFFSETPGVVTEFEAVIQYRITAPLIPMIQTIISAINHTHLTDWPIWFHTASGHISELLSNIEARHNELSDFSVIRDISCLCPDQVRLFLANSLPVTLMEWFGVPTNRILPIFANRGTRTLDGVIATACGIGFGAQAPVIAVVGDISFYRDSASLALVNQLSASLIIIVLNNSGRGLLPLMAEQPLQAQLYTTQKTQFEHMARHYAIHYEKVETTVEFEVLFGRAVQSSTPVILDVILDAGKCRDLYHQIQSQLEMQIV